MNDNLVFSFSRNLMKVCFPVEFWNNKHLNCLDFKAYAYCSYYSNSIEVKDTNDLAEFCGCSERKARKSIKKLQKLSYLAQEEKEILK